MLDFYADKGIVAEIEMALLAVMHEGDSIPTIEGLGTRLHA
jgi:aerobic-type carbon monoxide dehydrogenase small subunit (CoxS/CutS family)